MKLNAPMLCLAAALLSLPFPSYMPYWLFGLGVIVEILLAGKLASITTLVAAQVRGLQRWLGSGGGQGMRLQAHRLDCHLPPTVPLLTAAPEIPTHLRPAIGPLPVRRRRGAQAAGGFRNAGHPRRRVHLRRQRVGRRLQLILRRL
jgi:hypothetical protein